MEKFEASDGLKKLQAADENMLAMLVKMLDEHDIEYYAIAGTLLGAVRHQGFIPWDDDLDIGIPRKSYDRLLAHLDEWLSDDYYWDNFHTNPNYKYFITRVYSKRAKVRELRNDNPSEYSNASIDLFPLDGTPNNKFARTVFLKKIMAYRAMASFANLTNIDNSRRRSLIEKMVISFAIVLHTDKFLDAKYFYNKIEKTLITQSFENSEFVGSLMGAYREKELFKREWLGSKRQYRFGTLDITGPEHFSKYLQHMYGNYMAIPSVESIKEKRHFEIIED